MKILSNFGRRFQYFLLFIKYDQIAFTRKKGGMTFVMPPKRWGFC